MPPAARRYADDMSTLVLTVAGADRSGLVSRVAAIVEAHDGNWESSELAELAGTFAGVIAVSVPDARASALRSALAGIDGLVTIVSSGAVATPDESPHLLVRVLGNDRPGIVREVTGVLAAHGVSIDRMTTETRDAAMAGGRLFEASITAVVPEGSALSELIEALEQIATDIQVDVAVAADV